MIQRMCLTVLLFVSGVAAAELSEKFAKRLEAADANYQLAVQKADNVRFYAVQKAAQERLRILKTALADATKAGDFDAATEIKARVAAAETAGGLRPKPKNVVKFGGHEYALIEDAVTWHVAKRLCEEMGGHLAITPTNAEMEFLFSICRKAKTSAWVGATDEEAEGQWKWVDGTAAQLSNPHISNTPNNAENNMLLNLGLGAFNDIGDGRAAFLCEWDT